MLKRGVKEKFKRKNLKKSEKGLSTIVATLLIILLTLVAVGIIWVVVRNVIQGGSEQISLGKFTLDLKISQVQENVANNSLIVTLKRNAGEGEFVGINFIVEDDANSEVIKQNISMMELQTKSFQLYFITINVSKLKKISIAPVYRLESGKEVNGDVKDTWESSSGISSPLDLPQIATCSDGIQNQGEIEIDCGGSNCPACVTYLRTFYISNSGNDTNNGTTLSSPWKTIAKVNSQTFLPGDGILFKRGDTWREQLIPYSGSSAGYIAYGAYGGGAKPKFLGSVTANSGWSEVSTNIWQNSNAAFTIDVGNLIFNNEESVGVKIMSASPTLDAQGEFWYDFVNDRIRMYSVGNPATVYTNIECALRRNIIQATSKNYNIFENLDLRYGASHGYGSSGVDHVIIRDCDLSFIGGGDQTGVYTVRYGNAIEFWANSHDIVVERCKINNIYDAGITPQGDSGGTGTYQVYNMYFRNNTVSNCEYSYELFWHDANASSHDIYFENNTCVNAGGGWGHNQRPDGVMGAHVRAGSILSMCSNIFIQNNIFYEATERTIYFHGIVQLNKLKLDYNNYYQSGNKSLAYNTDLNKNYYTLSDWQVASSQEAHAINSNPFPTTYFEFIWFSDIHVGDPAWTAGELNAFVSGMNGKVNPNTKFAVASGDEIYTTGLQSEVDTYNAAMTGLSTTLYSLRGNHDGNKFTQHFVVDYGNTRIIAFYASYAGLPNQGDPYNNTGNVSAAELAWIETQLQTANGKKCILVAHYPLSSNFWGYIRQGYGQEEIINLSNEYGVKLYLNGHQHDSNQIDIVGNNITDINSYAAVGPGKFMVVRIYNDNRVVVTPYNGLTPFASSTPIATVAL